MKSNPSTAPKASRTGLVGWVASLWTRFVVDSLADEERTSRARTEGRPPERIEWKVVGIFVLSAISLMLLEYLGKSSYYWEYIHARPVSSGAFDVMKMTFAQFPHTAPVGWHRLPQLLGPVRELNTPDAQLSQLLYWAAWCVFTYLVLPGLFVVFVLREKLTDYGLTLRGTFKHMWLYVLMFLVVVPFVFMVADSPTFQQQYPFYRAAVRDPRGLLLWELAYAAQFFSLEFFFRGFMVHGLKGRLGAYAVLAMVVPYCMIHFGKPMPETFGAIIAGTVLGILSLRTGSIFLGFLIHVSVALSMDLASLSAQGVLDTVMRGIF